MSSLAADAPESQVQEMNIIINDQPVQFENSLKLDRGRIFVPVRPLVEHLNGEIDWNSEDQKVTIHTEFGDTIMFNIHSPAIKFNDQEYMLDVIPFIEDGRAYVPVRHAAEFLHTMVKWDPATATAFLTSIPLYTLEDGDNLELLSEKLDIAEELLLERNRIQSADELEFGQSLKIVIPTALVEELEYVEPEPEPEVKAPAEPHPDLDLLARIIMVESGYESYQGKLAVGSVIMNRVADSRFPDTVRGVIYAPGQFPPARNGKLDNAKPNEDSIRAAQAVLNGENNVEGALYFHNPRVTNGGFWDKLTTVEVIGNHRFVK